MYNFKRKMAAKWETFFTFFPEEREKFEILPTFKVEISNLRYVAREIIADMEIIHFVVEGSKREIDVQLITSDGKTKQIPKSDYTTSCSDNTVVLMIKLTGLQGLHLCLG